MLEGKKLEDETAETLWASYAETQLPPVSETGEFIREELRKAFYAGGWTMLALEQRLRRDTAERSTALLDRHREETEAFLRSVGAAGQQPH